MEKRTGAHAELSSNKKFLQLDFPVERERKPTRVLFSILSNYCGKKIFIFLFYSQEFFSPPFLFTKQDLTHQKSFRLLCGWTIRESTRRRKTVGPLRRDSSRVVYSVSCYLSSANFFSTFPHFFLISPQL